MTAHNAILNLLHEGTIKTFAVSRARNPPNAEEFLFYARVIYPIEPPDRACFFLNARGNSYEDLCRDALNKHRNKDAIKKRVNKLWTDYQMLPHSATRAALETAADKVGGGTDARLKVMSLSKGSDRLQL